MKRPIVCYVTDRLSLVVPAGSTREEALTEHIRDAARAGVDWIQIREKELDARSLFDVVSAGLAAARGSSARVVVNDRLDVAKAAGADGVHLGERSLPIADVVHYAHGTGAAKFLVGASCHSPEAAERAMVAGADYVFFGPVFATPSKITFGAPQGLEQLAEVCRRVSIPVLAIGGITVENASSCLDYGAAGVAAIRLFQEARDLTTLLGRLR
jgi:thiamine-phosphate pyrophosphorylase